ncbi:MAG: NAD-dependent epimerase/dehydratase family protein [Desulfobacteraceae bacterium]|nr:MAG: NAD-dependent epimerase/dehydratase family protein [Desulfobacteraceae bacterium]
MEWGRRYTLITGGAGFIGTNLADRILQSGKRVLILDNLSRPGVEENANWLTRTHGDLVQIRVADIRDPKGMADAVQGAEQIFHLAAQVAVTTSVDDPRMDLEVNLFGTFNLLEAVRATGRKIPLIFTSTNKVYGQMEGLKVRKNGSRYEPVEPEIRLQGLGEERPLSFCSPYGCSKGASDQYVLDYARTYDLSAAVFRMSCIYGPHQFGTEDQGWVAHFLISATEGAPITLYGDGFQVRDVLFVSDLVDAFLLAQSRIETIRGRAFNIGGGPSRAISLVELIERIEALQGSRPDVRFSDWRVGDQKYYVSNTGKFHKATGWIPRVDVIEGTARLHEWILAARRSPIRAAGAGGTT